MSENESGPVSVRGRIAQRVRREVARRRTEVGDALSVRRAAMYDAAETRKGTRPRAAVPMVGGLVGLGALFSLVTANVLAVNFTSANQSYKIYTDRVVGQYAAGYLNAQQKQNGPSAVAQVGFKQADLYGLCAIALQTLPAPLGQVSLVLTGGEPVNGTVTDPTKKISANELYMASNQISGNGENIQKLTLGQSADTLSMDTITTHRGNPGDFGLQAQVLQIANLDSDSYGIDLQGSINLPDLKIRVLPGVQTKTACTS